MNTTPSNIMEFCLNNNVNVITTNLIGDQNITTIEILRQFSINRTAQKRMAVYLHTYDDKEESARILEDYDGIYSNVLDESDFR